MFFRARRALHRSWFDFACRGLAETPPLPSHNSAVTVVSMVCHGEVRMYLLALKSLVRQLAFVPRVVVLNDGSLSEDDHRLMIAHVPGLRVVAISSVNTGSCPKGGCWERLLLISDIVQDGYVIQMDSDTMTLGPVPEVLHAVAENRCFTLLGDRSFPEVEPMLDACRRYRDNPDRQVQAVCERNFERLPQAGELKYLRGNAGFVGYAQGSLGRDRIQEFSDLMRSIAEGTWDTWGSEQLTSNLLIANAANPLPLPFPPYGSYWAHPEVNYDQFRFLHLIGPHRFDHGFYVRHARALVRTLQGEKGRS